MTCASSPLSSTSWGWCTSEPQCGCSSAEREEDMAKRIPRIGVGGPVGSGKTSLIERLVPRLSAEGRKVIVVRNDIDLAPLSEKPRDEPLDEGSLPRPDRAAD